MTKNRISRLFVKSSIWILILGIWILLDFLSLGGTIPLFPLSDPNKLGKRIYGFAIRKKEEPLGQ